VRWPPWRKRAPKAKPVEFPVLDALGREVGVISFDPNGVIGGKITQEEFRRKFNSAVTHGLISSLSMQVNFTAKKPPWKA